MAKGVQGQSVTSLTKSRIHLLLISMLHLAFRIQATLPSLCHRNTASGTAASHKRKRRESSIDEVDRALLSRLESTRMGKLLLVSTCLTLATALAVSRGAIFHNTTI